MYQVRWRNHKIKVNTDVFFGSLYAGMPQLHLDLFQRRIGFVRQLGKRAVKIVRCQVIDGRILLHY